MPVITFPDGNTRNFPDTVTVMEVAASIGNGLARATLAAEVNNCIVDSSYQVTNDAQIRIITDKDPEGLEIIRHSCAHLMAQAVKQLYPEVQVTIGPVIDNGFYYDYSYHRPFTLEDLEKIEQRMKELAKADIPVTRREMSREEAITFFRDQGEEFKVQIIQDIPAEERLSIYTQGNFSDLCRGPHVPTTGKLRAFKLTKVAAAYWRGDARNQSLQRIYGTAWQDKKALKAWLKQIEEAERRDHRKLAKKLDLFHFQEESPGMAFWHPRGWTLYNTIKNYISQLMQKNGYQEISTPQLVDRSLWERSGHWEKFRRDMFVTESESRDYAIKPMNCPGHVMVFNQGLKSYRDLPLRLAEFGSCHRNELSGALHGLMRARYFIQDDAHIFCTEEQIQSEVARFIDILYATYADFGFTEVLVHLSTRPEKRVGSDAVWDKAEDALRQALDTSKLEWELQPGEGAFYGPKIEFSLKDCIGRVWQCGTVQVDFSMPEKLGACYIDQHSTKCVPVMLHRAILGSIERFIGILLEHYAGSLPFWLCPVQTVIISITEKQCDYARQIVQSLHLQGIRAISDLRNETIGLKIREHTVQRIPYLLIIGEREVANATVAVRTREGEDLQAMSVEDFLQYLLREHKATSK